MVFCKVGCSFHKTCTPSGRSTKELNYFWKLLEKSWNSASRPQWDRRMSPVLSAQLFLCQWQREATDGWCGVAQCGLIINSVLCCRGALDGCCMTSMRLNWCLSSFFFFFTTSTSLHRLQPPHLQSLPSQRGSPDSPPAVHVRGNNGSCECVWRHGWTAIVAARTANRRPPPKSYRHSCDAALSLPLDVTLREKKRKMKRSEREKEDPRRARAYFGYSATIKMRHPLAHEFTSGEKLLLMCL